MLNAAQLESARATAGLLLQDDIEVLGFNRYEDELGQDRKLVPFTIRTIKGRLTVATARVEDAAGRLTIADDLRLYVAWNADLSLGEAFRIGGPTGRIVWPESNNLIDPRRKMTEIRVKEELR
jgi:hypothetical protein